MCSLARRRSASSSHVCRTVSSRHRKVSSRRLRTRRLRRRPQPGRLGNLQRVPRLRLVPRAADVDAALHALEAARLVPIDAEPAKTRPASETPAPSVIDVVDPYEQLR